MIAIAIAIHATLHTTQKTLNTATPQAPAADLALLLAPQLPLLSPTIWQARNAGLGLPMIPIVTLMVQPEVDMMTMMAAIARMMMMMVTMSISPNLARIVERATMRMRMALGTYTVPQNLLTLVSYSCFQNGPDLTILLRVQKALLGIIISSTMRWALLLVKGITCFIIIAFGCIVLLSPHIIMLLSGLPLSLMCYTTS